MTTTTIENPRAITDLMSNEKKTSASPVIDSDASLLAMYTHEAFLLYERKRELKEEYKRRYAAETSAINEKLKELEKQAEGLRPKPRCFGKWNDCCSLPECDGCKHVLACHRATVQGVFE